MNNMRYHHIRFDLVGRSNRTKVLRGLIYMTTLEEIFRPNGKETSIDELHSSGIKADDTLRSKLFTFLELHLGDNPKYFTSDDLAVKLRDTYMKLDSINEAKFNRTYNAFSTKSEWKSNLHKLDGKELETSHGYLNFEKQDRDIFRVAYIPRDSLNIDRLLYRACDPVLAH